MVSSDLFDWLHTARGKVGLLRDIPRRSESFSRVGAQWSAIGGCGTWIPSCVCLPGETALGWAGVLVCRGLWMCGLRAAALQTLQ